MLDNRTKRKWNPHRDSFFMSAYIKNLKKKNNFCEHCRGYAGWVFKLSIVMLYLDSDVNL